MTIFFKSPPDNGEVATIDIIGQGGDRPSVEGTLSVTHDMITSITGGATFRSGRVGPEWG